MSRKNHLWLESSSQERLANQLADDIAEQLNSSIQTKGQAVIALSGGSTPKPMLEALSQREVDWSKVVITLVDERCVDDKHILSNARFIKKNLLDKLPQTANFVSIYDSGIKDLAEIFFKVTSKYCAATNSEIDQLAPFDIVVLGMGTDGHTASFFPDADNIDSLVDANTQEYLLSCESVSTQVTRVTWSLRMLLNTQMLARHITGKEKKQVFEKAAEVGSAAELPIRTAIYQNKSRLKVYYTA